MVLQKQVVAVPLAGGLDTKTDPKQVQPGKLLVAENVIMQRLGELKKCDGTTTLTSARTLSNGKQLSVLGNELCIATDSGFYSYGLTQGTWNYRSDLTNCQVTTTPLASGSADVRYPVGATAGNIALYAWVDPLLSAGSGAVVSTLVDTQTGAVISPASAISGSRSTPRVIAIAGRYAVLAYLTSGNGISCVIYDSQNPGSPTSVALTASATSVGHFDICSASGNNFALVHATGSFDLYGYVYSAASGAAVVGSTNLSINITATPANSTGSAVTLAPITTGGNYLSLLYIKNKQQLWHVGYTTSLGAYKTATQLDFTVGYPVNMSAVNGTYLTATNAMVIVYNLRGADDYSATSVPIRLCVLDLSTNFVYGTTPYTIGDGLLTGRIFAINSMYWFLAAYERTLTTSAGTGDGLQTANFLYSTYGSEAMVQAALLPNGKSGAPAYLFGSPSSVTSTKITYPILLRNRISSDNGRLFTTSTVAVSTLDFSASRLPPGQALGSNLYLPGGMLKSYDGSTVTEGNFLLWPDITSVTPSGVGSIASGSYLYRAVYEWRDANGQVLQSAPSYPPGSLSASGGTGAIIRVRALNATQKKILNASGLTDVSIVLYRTTIASPSTYYRISSTTSPTLNTSGVRSTGYVDITDTAADASITGNQILYTVGGEVENVAPPAPAIVLSFKNRLFVVSNEDPSAVYYSKEIVVGSSPAFNDSFRISVNPQLGNITALGSLDDKLVIFKAAAIYVVAGDGPLPTGQQNTFSEAGKLATDVGCSNPSSVVETPLGLMFQSAKGIYLLDRSLSIQYVGAAVESFNSLTVSGAFVLTYANQVRFTTVEGTTLVFDYIQNVWTVRTNEASVGSVTWNSKATYLRSAGTVAVETSGQANSDGSPILTKVKTSFQSFAGLQGFQRVWRVLVLGEFQGNHVLKVSIFTDYKTTADDTFYVAVGDSTFCAQSSVLAVTTQTATFTGGSSDSAYQFAVKPRVQKCEAMAVQIEDAFPTGAATKAFNVSSVSFEVGVKGTLKKLSTSANMLKG